MLGLLQPDQRVVILGSGPTGLGAAHRLRELGHENFHIYDRDDQVGGLATSFKDEQGFTWDIGGHVQFSHYRYFDELMDKALNPPNGPGWLDHEREVVGLDRRPLRALPFPEQYPLSARRDALEVHAGADPALQAAVSGAPEKLPRVDRRHVRRGTGRRVHGSLQLQSLGVSGRGDGLQLDRRARGRHRSGKSAVQRPARKRRSLLGAEQHVPLPEARRHGRDLGACRRPGRARKDHAERGCGRLDPGAKKVHFADGSEVDVRRADLHAAD